MFISTNAGDPNFFEWDPILTTLSDGSTRSVERGVAQPHDRLLARVRDLLHQCDTVPYGERLGTRFFYARTLPRAETSMPHGLSTIHSRVDPLL
jgi:hypothetical protein